MSFFDKKEEVLDLKLTPYGRHLLSRGKLKPVYYAFLDDDIVYDSDAANFTETNNEIKARIIDETPSLKPHYTMNSVETTINENVVDEIELAKARTIENYQNEYLNSYRSLNDLNLKYLQNTIGTSDPVKNNAPRWDIVNLEGEIVKANMSTQSSVSSSAEYSNDIDTPSIVSNIPQIEIEIDYDISRGFSSDSDFETVISEARSANLPEPEVYNDGTYLKISEDQLLSRILERNGFEFNEAFEIQVFKNKKGNNNTTNNWELLKFLNKPNNIIHDILMDDEEAPFELQEVTNKTVEYYFDIRADEEIPLRDLCKSLSKLNNAQQIANELGINIEVDCKDVLVDAGSLINPPGPTDPCEDVDCDDEDLS